MVSLASVLIWGGFAFLFVETIRLANRVGDLDRSIDRLRADFCQEVDHQTRLHACLVRHQFEVERKAGLIPTYTVVKPAKGEGHDDHERN